MICLAKQATVNHLTLDGHNDYQPELSWNASNVSFIHVCTILGFITAVVYWHGQRWQMIKIAKHTHTLSPFPFSSLYLSVCLSISNSFIPSQSPFHSVSVSLAPSRFLSLFFPLPPFLLSLLYLPYLVSSILSHIFIAIYLASSLFCPSLGDHKGNNRSCERVRLCNLCMCVWNVSSHQTTKAKTNCAAFKCKNGKMVLSFTCISCIWGVC